MGARADGMPKVIVVMGVAGAGKTTVGQALAESLGWRFYDGDDYHPAANVEKMCAGRPLTDADRAPWLNALRRLIAGVIDGEGHAVLACSALRQTYRDELIPDGAPVASVQFVYLRVSKDVLTERLKKRSSHFARPELLPSQLATLEEPNDAIWVDGSLPIDKIVDAVRRSLSA